MRVISREYRNQYFDDYCDYLRKLLDEKRTEEGKPPYSDSTIRTFATDTFYLERHETRDFMEWTADEDAFEEAGKVFLRYFKCRRTPEADVRYYLNCLKMFRMFLEYMDNKKEYIDCE